MKQELSGALREDLLADRVVLITGGGGGLGLAMGAHFLRLGAMLALCGRSEATLKTARKTLNAGERVFAASADVRDPEAVRDFVNSVHTHFGRIDALVNNAAGNFYAVSEDLSYNGFKSVVDTVLMGSFNCTQAVGQRWIEEGRPGSILNIVTTYTQSGSAFVLPSACAKAGVAAMTTTLAYEWACYGIRVNGLAPGPIPTEGAWARLVPNADFEALYRERLPYKRFGTPTELANVAAFLLSDAASYINGAILPMDGGEHLQGGEFNFLTQLMPREKLRSLFASMKPKK